MSRLVYHRFSGSLRVQNFQIFEICPAASKCYFSLLCNTRSIFAGSCYIDLLGAYIASKHASSRCGDAFHRGALCSYSEQTDKLEYLQTRKITHVIDVGFFLPEIFLNLEIDLILLKEVIVDKVYSMSNRHRHL